MRNRFTTGADPRNTGSARSKRAARQRVPRRCIVEARTTDNAYGKGHQFFITYKSTMIPADSAGGYSIFGQVSSGLTN